MADNQIAFALEILTLLAEQPLKKAELSIALGDRGFSAEDLPQKITRMIAKLRNCGFQIRSAPNRPYELVDSNFPVILSEEQQQALAMAAYFLSDMGFTDQASQIIRIAKLDETKIPAHVKVNFSPPVNYSETNLDEIVKTLQERLQKRRRFSIRYRSANGHEKNWDCDRSELRLHRGVLYLFAHTPDFSIQKSIIERNQSFRVDRIINIQPASDISWGFLQFPTAQFCYRMSGPLSNYQPRRANERELHRDSDGKFVVIESEEENWFWFRQRLLQYGENICLLSPLWAVQKISRELEQSALMYIQKKKFGEIVKK